ncbi:hypothetical protein AB0M94_37220 [Streptomyces xanthochromogenes]|uniref:hypothetical protein n=1 Tax=Streptomyces xanthochromogenes TaxID=67384 RepID=UPI00342550BB
MGTDAVGRRDGERASGADTALPRRTAIAVTAGVLLGFFVIDGSYLWAEHPPRWECVAAVIGLVAVLGPRLLPPGPAPRAALRRYGSWGPQGLLAHPPVLGYGAARDLHGAMNAA